MKKFLSLVLALVMTMSLVTVSAGAKDFKDADKISYVEAVEVMQTIGVIDGFEDGSFKPAEGLTRAQAAKIISNMILGPATADAMKATAAPFKDVPASHWAAGYIAYCSTEGIVNGVGNGNFNPNGALTGFEFLKMLLGALGYDAEVEGYVGGNWAVNVAKRAIQLGLDDGLVSALNGKKAATREEACLYALNTLKTPMVEYENTSSITIGDVVIKNSSKAKEIESSNDSFAAGKKLEFAEKYFKKLHLNANKVDDMGRPANEWSYENWKETYAKAADYTHMGDTKIYKIYDAMGLSDKIAKDKIEVWTDGNNKNAKGEVVTAEYDLTNKGDDKDQKFGKGAAELSLYLKKDTDGKITGMTMVIVNTYIGQVTKVGTNKDNERYVKVANLEFVTDKFAKDDWVLYTKDVKNADNKAELLTLTLAEKMTGKLTMKTDGKYVIDGTTYKVAPTGKNNISGNVKDTVDFYLADGMLIKMDVAAENDNVASAALVLNTWGTNGGRDDAMAKLVFADGTCKKVVTTKDYSTGSADAIANNSVVTYSVNSNGEYKLTKKDTTAQLNQTLVAKQTSFGGKTLNDKTTFVYVINDKGDLSYKVVTGYKNSLKADNATVTAYVKGTDSFVSVLFVQVDLGKLQTNSDEFTVVAYKDVKITDDGDNTYYVYNAVVDGKVTTVKVAAETVTKDFADAAKAKGFVFMTDTTVDSNDIIVDGTKCADPTGEYAVEVKDGVLVLGTTGRAWTDDVTVVFVDDGDIEVGSIDDIELDNNGEEDPYANICAHLNEKHEVDYIVLVKK